MNAHTALVNELRIALSQMGHTSMLNVTGLFFRRIAPNKYAQVKTGQKGWPDIIGFTRKGRFFGVEAKTGSGRLSPEQKQFREISSRNNALFIEARSVQDLEALRDE